MYSVEVDLRRYQCWAKEDQTSLRVPFAKDAFLAMIEALKLPKIFLESYQSAGGMCHVNARITGESSANGDLVYYTD